VIGYCGHVSWLGGCQSCYQTPLLLNRTMVDFTIAGPNNNLNVKMVHSTLADTCNSTTLDSMEQRLQQGVNLGASCI
jgi:hypothetical protein